MGRTIAHLLRAAGTVVALAGLAGCESDSFFDPSVVGRWENTPTVSPVLERIDVIERDTGQFVEYTQVLPEDLIPEPTDYRIQPGDGVIIEIENFTQGGQPGRYERLVDGRGYLDVPQIGRVLVLNRTRIEVENAVAEAIKAARILEDPLVTVQVPAQRQATFGVFGRVAQPGRFAIAKPDYRLLEAMTDAGGLAPEIPNVYIIRQVALSDVVKTGVKGAGRAPSASQADEPAKPEAPSGEDLIDLIDELTAPPAGTSAPPPETPDAPGASPAAFRVPGERATGVPRRTATASAMQPTPQDAAPPIDLVDDAPVVRADTTTPSDQPATIPGKWVFLNGEWLQVAPATAESVGLPEGEDPLENVDPAADLITQRVIEVPVGPLLQGVAQYNIIVRPGDLITVPGPELGIVYAMGPGISRPGTYSLPQPGQMTLMRLIAAAGGLSAIGIPERVDITRMVGENRQATVRVNVRAIFEGTEPDLVLRADDLVNFGTNFWALPLAVVRGGLRASYGFGFLLDRNFGNDVFGAPPTNQFGQ